MNRKNYTIDAVVSHDRLMSVLSDRSSVSVLGCGLRRALPILLEITELRGCRVLSVFISETEATLTVPCEDAGRVFAALASLITQKATDPYFHSTV